MRQGKRILSLATAALLTVSLVGCSTSSDNKGTKSAASSVNTQTQSAEYNLIQNVYNWGSNYSRIVLKVKDADSLDYLNASNYTVNVERFDKDNNSLGKGTRTVQAVYQSDAEGNASVEDDYVTLSMGVGASSSLASPYYTKPETGLKEWAVCDYEVANVKTNDVWDELGTVYHPDEEKFDTGEFAGTDGVKLPYASYTPDDKENKPLIVWLHGKGSGGTDIGFVTGGMLVTNFITEETQQKFDGAYVLLPQAKTMWMDSGDGQNTNDGSSMYAKSLQELVENFVSENSGIDTNRIYIGGCSNGGFMALRMIIDNPDYYAAAFPICEAMQDSWVTDEALNAIKDIPMWFVHSSNDPTVDPEVTVVPTYNRLKAANAAEVHFTYYDKVVDPEYGNEYTGHFTWVYSLLDMCTNDFDGNPVQVNSEDVTLYQWLSAQSK